MSIAEVAPEMGHNRPPIRDLMADTNDSLPTYLEQENADLVARRDELLEAAERVPETIADEEQAGRVSDFIKQLSAASKEASTRRVGNKEPALQAGRLIDGFFRKLTDDLDKAKAAITGRLTIYQREKAEAERQAREAAEREAKEKADRLAKEAAKLEQEAVDATTLEDAIAAEEAAKNAAADAATAQKTADANAADLSRTRGDYGAVSSLRTFWDFKDLDRATLDLNTLREHLPQDALEKAVRAFVKAGGRELRGAVIFENTKTVVR